MGELQDWISRKGAGQGLGLGTGTGTGKLRLSLPQKPNRPRSRYSKESSKQVKQAQQTAPAPHCTLGRHSTRPQGHGREDEAGKQVVTVPRIRVSLDSTFDIRHSPYTSRPHQLGQPSASSTQSPTTRSTAMQSIN